MELHNRFKPHIMQNTYKYPLTQSDFVLDSTEMFCRYLENINLYITLNIFLITLVGIGFHSHEIRLNWLQFQRYVCHNVTSESIRL